MMYVNVTTTPVFGAPTKGRHNIWARLRRMAALRKQRLDLSRLSNDQLSDIGVSRAEANQEALRHSWDAPKNWMR